jgi:hypothetical protein
MANVTLDKDMFFRRMKRLYAAWKVSIPANDSLSLSLSLFLSFSLSSTSELWSPEGDCLSLLCIFCFRQDGEVGTDDSFSKIDCLVSAVGTDEDIVYSKSTALQVHGL